MFEKILLTLDGSPVAEVAVPYAEFLAGRLGAELILLHVNSERESNPHMYEIYLNSMAGAMRLQIKKSMPQGGEPRVQTVVTTGDPGEVIHNYIEKNAISLVVMSTRGSSGIKLWLLGSVADKVIRAVNIPVLLVRAKEPQTAASKKKVISRILLPLDGSATSKAAVPCAMELARKLKASVTLFRMAERVSEMMAYLLPYRKQIAKTYEWMDTAAVKDARSYLVGVEKELRQEGIPVTHVVTSGVDPAYEILEQEKKTNADLVVMASRGKSPIDAWSIGSVAEKVLHSGGLPLLLVRNTTK